MLYKIGFTSTKEELNLDGSSTSFCRLRLDYPTDVAQNAKRLGIEILPVCIPPCAESIAKYCEYLDGIVFTGGDLNIDPIIYEDESDDCYRSAVDNVRSCLLKKHSLRPKEIDLTGRIEFDINLMKSFLRTKKPLLGICLGMEILNVALGGTLRSVEDKRSYFRVVKNGRLRGDNSAQQPHENPQTPKTADNEEYEKSASFLVEKIADLAQNDDDAALEVSHFKTKTYADAVSLMHNVHFVVDNIGSVGSVGSVGSAGAAAMDEGWASAEVVETLKVNSAHSRCVDKLGDELSPFCFAEDGTIEGLVHANHPFAVGVQWHPELIDALPEKPAFPDKYNPVYQFLMRLGRK